MLPTGTLVDAYEILGPLGRGGMGGVYKARDTRVDRVVAVKVLPASSAGAFDAEGRFQREARALAALSHPRICSLFEFTRYDGRALLVMEYLEGQSLSARLGGGGMALHDALRVAVEVADGLAAAHRAGLVHGTIRCRCRAPAVQDPAQRPVSRSALCRDRRWPTLSGERPARRRQDRYHDDVPCGRQLGRGSAALTAVAATRVRSSLPSMTSQW